MLGGTYLGAVFGGGQAVTAGTGITTVGNNLDTRWAVRAAVSDVLDTRWVVAGTVGDTLDAQWGIHSAVSDTIDTRWTIQATIGQSSDVRWTVRDVVACALDTQWAARAGVGNQADTRWAVRAVTSDTVDARWIVRATAGDALDSQWAVRAPTGATIDVRWAVDGALGVVGNTIDTRWVTRAPTGGSLDTRWTIRLVTENTVTAQWQVQRNTPILRLLPDTKLAVVTYLAAHADLPGSVTVAGATNDDLSGRVPFVAVYRVPSPPPLMWAAWDTATLNIQVWAATEQAARDTAATVHAILHTLPGCTSASVVVQAVTDVTGLGQNPDPGLPDLHRYQFTVQVKARTA
jgi:hypothetical protein